MVKSLIKKSPYSEAENKRNLQASGTHVEHELFVDRKPSKLRIGDILEWIYSDNLAFSLSEDELHRIGEECKNAYQLDLESNQDKFDRIDDAEKLIRLQSLKENPNDPWEGAAATCHPQAAESTYNYWSRMVIAFLKDDQVAKYRVTGDDPGGEKAAKASRISQFVSYYLLNNVDGFLQSVSSIFMQQPCGGKAFIKAYYDPIEDGLAVDTIATKNIVADSFMKSVARGNRFTHRYFLYGHEIEEKIRTGEYLDMEWDMGGVSKEEGSDSGDEIDNTTISSSMMDQSQSYLILEMCCRIDLDKDGYAEPYIVFIHEASGNVLRIKPCFDEDTVFIRVDDQENKNDEARVSSRVVSLKEYLIEKQESNQKQDENEEVFIAKIRKIEYLAEIPFMPDVSGGFYGTGIVEIMVETIKTINRLSDSLINSAEAMNYQGGICSEDLLTTDGGTDIQLVPNGLVKAQFTGDDIRKHILFLPRHEPSPVALEMRNRMISDAEKFDGSTALMSGQMPTGNTPVGTVQALLEQGMQKYSAVMKMTYIGFRDFLRIVDRLLRKHKPKNMFYLDSKGQPNQLKEEDLDDDGMIDICPVADPNDITNFQKFMKAQILMQSMNAIGAAGGNVNELIRRYIEAAGISDIDKIITPESQPPPSPEMLMQQMKSDELSLRAMESAHNYELERDKVEIELHKMMAEIKRINADAQLKLADAESKNIGIQYEQAMAELTEYQSRESMIMDQLSRMRAMKMSQKPQGENQNVSDLQRRGQGQSAVENATPTMGENPGNPMVNQPSAVASASQPL